MSESIRSSLKTLLLTRYNTLCRRLERQVGSRENAADALQETWLRLEAMSEGTAPVASEAYLMRMATNAAIDQYRRDQRQLSDGEVDAMFEIPDELADPERIVAARRKVDTLKSVVRGLSPRQQEILQAARLEGQLNREIAERMGISLRLVEKELSYALQHCTAQMREIAAEEKGNTKGRRKF
ncbi:RNA polymerase sigma factor [Paraburkholderia sp. ZP32-5]|uniref:RNA polymerase sigma factor n=1 Tax=Paraburkholderia sp. ZP32-5 TaxID=2883245 RepID=UPI001F3AB222|nr:RNA polymerase sigma factor [Paraburkholderia sp. ZP32-5]